MTAQFYSNFLVACDSDQTMANRSVMLLLLLTPAYAQRIFHCRFNCFAFSANAKSRQLSKWTISFMTLMQRSFNMNSQFIFISAKKWKLPISAVIASDLVKYECAKILLPLSIADIKLISPSGWKRQTLNNYFMSENTICTSMTYNSSSTWHKVAPSPSIALLLACSHSRSLLSFDPLKPFSIFIVPSHDAWVILTMMLQLLKLITFSIILKIRSGFCFQIDLCMPQFYDAQLNRSFFISSYYTCTLRHWTHIGQIGIIL